MPLQGAEECPNCGGPIRDGKCNYCDSQDLLKQAFAGGKCRNCGAKLDVLRDKDNWLVCRYCGWPIRKEPTQKVVEEQTQSAVIDRPRGPSRGGGGGYSSSPLGSVVRAGLGFLFIGIFAIVILAILGGFSGNIWPSANVTKITTNIADATNTAWTYFLPALLGLMMIGVFLTLIGYLHNIVSDSSGGQRGFLVTLLRRIIYKRRTSPRDQDTVDRPVDPGMEAVGVGQEESPDSQAPETDGQLEEESENSAPSGPESGQQQKQDDHVLGPSQEEDQTGETVGKQQE